jgi:hypothetical protein
MVRSFILQDDLGDVVPQAIFWRPINYFCRQVRHSTDDFDEYEFATFEIGNWLRFDLRKYRGHPEFTSTLYLQLQFDNAQDINHAVLRIVDEFKIPRFAVAWKRGEEFEYGGLQRRRNDRLRETEARVLVLKIASACPNHTATTDMLIEQMPDFLELSEIDLRISNTRPNQPRWHQIVRNVISHRDSPLGPFELGYALRTDNGISVTPDGLSFLARLGYVT